MTLSRSVSRRMQGKGKSKRKFSNDEKRDDRFGNSPHKHQHKHPDPDDVAPAPSVFSKLRSVVFRR
jgi:hypothetical protein